MRNEKASTSRQCLATCSAPGRGRHHAGCDLILADTAPPYRGEFGAVLCVRGRVYCPLACLVFGPSQVNPRRGAGALWSLSA